jgi:hypothetical protein
MHVRCHGVVAKRCWFRVLEGNKDVMGGETFVILIYN